MWKVRAFSFFSVVPFSLYSSPFSPLLSFLFWFWFLFLFCAFAQTLSYSLFNIRSQDKSLDGGPNKGRTVSASSGYTSSWAQKNDFDWDKIGVENCDVDLADKDFKCKAGTEHRAGSIRRAFKDWLDKVTGLEMEISTGNAVEATSQEDLELYLLNKTNGYTLREQTQTRDLLKIADCTSACFPVASADTNIVAESEYCARCGYAFAQKYRLMRKTVLLKPSTEFHPLQSAADLAPDTAFNFTLQEDATKSYSNYGVTNNERLIMCSCFKSCGPYVQSGNGFQPVRTFAQELPNFVTVLYGASVNGSLLAWTLVLSVTVAWLFKRNSQAVSDDYSADQRFYFQDKIGGLNKRNMALQKKYNRLKMAIDA
jgi:hypothetical protein